MMQSSCKVLGSSRVGSFSRAHMGGSLPFRVVFAIPLGTYTWNLIEKNYPYRVNILVCAALVSGGRFGIVILSPTIPYVPGQVALPIGFGSYACLIFSKQP